MGLLGDLWNLINEEEDVDSVPDIFMNEDTLTFSDCDLEIPLSHICDLEISEHNYGTELIFKHITGFKFSVPLENFRMDSEDPDLGTSMEEMIYEASNNSDLSMDVRISYIETVLESFTSASKILATYLDYRLYINYDIKDEGKLYRSVGFFIREYWIFREDNRDDSAEFYDWEDENQSRIEELDDIIEFYREKIGLGEDSVEAYALSKLRLNEYINKINKIFNLKQH